MSNYLDLTDMRGKLEIVHSGTYFINDEEELKLRLMVLGKLLYLKIVFVPSKTAVLNPPIEISSDENDKVIVFKGWNQMFVYSAVKPIKLTEIKGRTISFSTFNMYLSGTNRLDLQLYAEE